MPSNQTNNARTNNTARMFRDDPDSLLAKYVLSLTAKEQNNRKLEEHLEKIRKFSGKPPTEVITFVLGRNLHQGELDSLPAH